MRSTTNDLKVLGWVVAALGAANAVTGLSLLLTPVWFYDTLAEYAPYNRHFIGDAGGFVLALCVGLLAAARDLPRHRLVIGVAALGSGVHAVNHFVDDVLSAAAVPGYWATNTLPLLAMAVLQAYVYVRLGRAAARPSQADALYSPAAGSHGSR